MKTKLISLAGAAVLGAAAFAITPAAASPVSPAPLGNAIDEAGTGIEQVHHRRYRHRHHWRHHGFWPWWGYQNCFYTRSGRLVCYH